MGILWVHTGAIGCMKLLLLESLHGVYVQIFWCCIMRCFCDGSHQVVCRMAGFSSAVGPVTDSYYGRGSGRVWLDSVQCQGHEASIELCQHLPWGDVLLSCLRHNDDAGVVCSDGEYRLTLNTIQTQST